MVMFKAICLVPTCIFFNEFLEGAVKGFKDQLPLAPLT